MRFFAFVAVIGCLLSTPALAQGGPKEKPAPALLDLDKAKVDEPKVRYTPPATTDKTNLWLLDLSDGGRVTIWLRPDVAPKMVARVKELTRDHFYDGLAFHRVIDGFMAQGGDPKGDGTGGSSLPNVPAEFNYLPHVRGAVAAARAEAEDSANSQFYIVFQPRLSLDKKYTIFGRVLDGMQYVDGIERGEPPTNPTRVLHAYIASDDPPAYTAAPAVPATLGPAPTLPGTAPTLPKQPAAKAASPTRKASVRKK